MIKSDDMNPLVIDPRTTALVLIDLQQSVVALPVVPHPAAEVVANAVRLLERFRSLGSTVVLVRVAFLDGKDRLNLPVDAPPPGRLGKSEFIPEVGPKENDIVITKRQWGAFYGTELDLQLRRRGIRTIVIGGIATNFGVESTARDAFERGYEQVFAEDAMSGLSAEGHQFAVDVVFPRIGRVRSTDAVLQALA
jgi:nicotinamidase-related amidase